MKLKMINSVGELAAGDEVEVAEEIGDRYIILGYAEGKLSRVYDDEEREQMLADNQEVSV